ncbi:hypothetical protein BDQ17DRAFT_1263827 [Cyathus striatus]|nr:hypothetical protein BDQ17DRAFT_1263827 [Cyathus striatus]
MSTPLVNGIKETHRHKDYYITGGDLHLIAEHTHFLIHAYFFLRESEYFRGLLQSSAGDVRKASNLSTPLHVDASPDDFATFLTVFYNPKYAYFGEMTISDWIVILSLAHKWQFPEVKALAIRELDKIELDLVPRIALYNKNIVDVRYILPLYAKLCAWKKAPTEEEAEMLDKKTLTFVFRARERLRAPDMNSNSGDGSEDLISPLPSGTRRSTVEGIIRGMLKIEPDTDDLGKLGQGNVLSNSIRHSSERMSDSTIRHFAIFGVICRNDHPV